MFKLNRDDNEHEKVAKSTLQRQQLVISDIESHIFCVFQRNITEKKQKGNNCLLQRRVLKCKADPRSILKIRNYYSHKIALGSN